MSAFKLVSLCVLILVAALACAYLSLRGLLWAVAWLSGHASFEVRPSSDGSRYWADRQSERVVQRVTTTREPLTRQEREAFDEARRLSFSKLSLGDGTAA